MASVSAWPPRTAVAYWLPVVPMAARSSPSLTRTTASKLSHRAAACPACRGDKTADKAAKKRLKGRANDGAAFFVFIGFMFISLQQPRCLYQKPSRQACANFVPPSVFFRFFFLSLNYRPLWLSVNFFCCRRGFATKRNGLILQQLFQRRYKTHTIWMTCFKTVYAISPPSRSTR